MPVACWHRRSFLRASSAIRRQLRIYWDPFSGTCLPTEDAADFPKPHILQVKICPQGAPGFLQHGIRRPAFGLMIHSTIVPCDVCRVRFATHFPDTVCQYMSTGRAGLLIGPFMIQWKLQR